MLRRSAFQADTVAERLALAAEAAAHADYEAALGIWVELGHAGVARAQAEIGRCFVQALGVARDAGLALKWLMPAAQAGDALAQRLLGDFYFNGEDGTPNRAIAEEWYARAAEQGEPHAQDMLSWMLVDSDHRKPDHKQAMQWALKAAGQGVAASMTRIGILYNNALGVDRDVAAAAAWWRKAALKGDADGQAMLGAAYHLGAGVARDPVASLAWLIRARAARSPFADRYYGGVRESCTAEQRQEAERAPRSPWISPSMPGRRRHDRRHRHEGLVHNTLAGATGIDFVMLVVAADDGVMPQTREHLAIMDLLGLTRGVVALNKCDLASEDQRAAAAAGIEAVLAGTGLEGAPIVPVSAVTGEGIAELTAILDRATALATSRPKQSLFRLAVDRSFTLAGLGTAVTGTVLSGSVRLEDRVEPLSRRSRNSAALNLPSGACAATSMARSMSWLAPSRTHAG